MNMTEFARLVAKEREGTITDPERKALAQKRAERAKLAEKLKGIGCGVCGSRKHNDEYHTPQNV